jgi:hypothetical protein
MHRIKSLFSRFCIFLRITKEKDKKYPTLDKEYVEAITKLADEKVNRRFIA